MKEVTRIHIAKTSYDVELEAKKELESYLKALENYSGDADILTDVEIRITEILDERGVKKNGVVAADDVKALKEQLGEPREFQDDEHAPTENIEVIQDSNRKLFRDTDRAVFGGVLAGIASFFKVNPALVRILFIIVALASFGTALLVYAVLWIAVPPARTAADRLQMAGQPVTVESIREFNENDATRKDVQVGANRRVLTAIAGIVCVMGAGVAAMLTVMGVFAVVFGSQHYVIEADTGAQYLVGAFGLAVLSGTLLTVLCILGAYASFAQKLTKRVLISMCIVIVAGLVSFGGVIGLAKFGSYQHSDYIDANTRSQTVPMPAKSNTISTLSIDTHDVRVKYYVTSGTPYAQLHAVVKNQSDLPTVQMSIEGKTLLVTATQRTSESCHNTFGWCNNTEPIVEVHGPAFAALSVANDAMIEYDAESQAALQINAKNNVSVDVMSGTIQSMTVYEGEDSAVSTRQATVYNLAVATIGSSSELEAGTVRSLDVKDEGSCPSHVRSARVIVWKVTSGLMTFNGQKKQAATMDSGCTEIDIEGEEDAQ
jgi:phage shock protein PspC (stress-responsive transcriptional regulator)